MNLSDATQAAEPKPMDDGTDERTAAMQRYEAAMQQALKSAGNLGEQSSVIPASWRGVKDTRPFDSRELRYVDATDIDESPAESTSSSAE